MTVDIIRDLFQILEEKNIKHGPNDSVSIRCYMYKSGPFVPLCSSLLPLNLYLVEDKHII